MSSITRNCVPAEDEIYKYLQIALVSIGVITAAITGLRYMRKQLLRDMKADLCKDLEPIEQSHNDMKVRLSIVEKTVALIEKYFIKSSSRNKKEDNNNNRDG